MSGAGSKGKDIPRVDVADLAAGLGARFSGGSHTTDTQSSHTSRTADAPSSESPRTASTSPSDTSRTPGPATVSTTRQGRRPGKPAGSETAAGNIRRSLYTHTTAFAALDDAAARISAATGGLVQKHDAIARLVHAGVARTDEVIAEITQELTARLAQPAEAPHTDS